jgi:[acyl-carrier-protein] S-malonyltransferase
MTVAFVFPGQGSQTIGMLAPFAELAVVNDTIAEASELLHQDLATLIAQGPADDLALTANTQPVMLATAVAFFRAWLAQGGAMPSVVAGHSLGEYSALVAAGAISLEQAIPLVRLRAQAMQDAVPVGVGAMAAILGMDSHAVCVACLDAAQGEVVEAVNFNDPAQTVIAGHKSAVERACELVKARGAKRALPLPVSAPFHSSLMKPAALRLVGYLESIDVAPPLADVINNVDVAIEVQPEAIKNALGRQACHPVRWVETVQAMRARGVTHVVECGPGKVLTGLTRRIDRDLVALSINDPVSLSQTLEQMS